ncbi:MAG: carboxymuconolactone decarboxylase family protein [Candidatus Dadabacteria bacterium]|nr:carboxymuconolactone decarboxylase family protein [Candidatus Dadabacteria bacterium]NIQ13572.1 carboxymuconolactone decarboxylase family protein [Candidatus Dadabacteria bacterium]
MSRESIYNEMKEMIGLVPGFFEEIPDDALENEWALFKKYILIDDTHIPAKYRELIGLAVASASHCWYCANFHAGTARLNGATDEEIQEAVHLAKVGRGWSTYLNGMVYDRDRFLDELKQVGEYLTSK